MARENANFHTVVLVNLELRPAPACLLGRKRSSPIRIAQETETNHVSHKMRKTLGIQKETRHCQSQEEMSEMGNILRHATPQNTLTKS